MTEYNLPCQLVAEGRKGKRRRKGPTEKETGLQPSTPPHAARASLVPPRARRPAPAPAAASRPTDPPRTRFLRSRTPALASPRDKAGQFSPLLGRGDSRGDVNTARPAARGPSPPPPPGSVTSSLSPAPRPALPAGQRAARLPLSPSLLPDRCPGALSPLPPAASPVSPPQPPENPPQTREQTTQARGGGAEGGGGTRDSEAFSPHPPRSLPPASAARALTCSPRRRGRPPLRFLSQQGRGLVPAAVGQASGGSRGLPAARAASLGEKTKQRRAAPRRAPRPRRSTDPPTAEATAATQSPARGAMVAPALALLPSLHPPPRLLPLGLLPPPPGHSSPLPPPRSLRALLPSPRGEGGRHRQSLLRLSNPGRLFIPRGAPSPLAPTSPPNKPLRLTRIHPPGIL